MSFFFLKLSRPKERQWAGITLGQDSSHYVLSNKENSLRIGLRKRKAYPGTYVRQTASGVTFGYGSPDPVDGEEFLTCELAKTGTLTIRRDAFGTLPIFYADTPSGLYVSNDYAALVHELPNPRFSPDAFAHAISDAGPMPGTFIEGVHILWPDETLSYRAGKLEVHQLHHRTWSLSSDAPPTRPHDFRKIFDDYMDYFVNTRLKGQRIGFEVSGGLDSGTLPQYFSRRNNDELAVAALILPGEQREYHQQKLEKFRQSVKSTAYLWPLDTRYDFPLARMVTRNLMWPTYFEKTYLEPTEAYIKRLSEQGVEVICTGSGGDELFGNVTEPDTSGFRLSRSVRYSRLCNNVYIEHGMWPVSPFIDPDLYEWVQGLPVHHRANKNILRAYHQANHFVPEIYNPRHNEEFTSFFTECFVSGVYDNFVNRLARNSYGADAGLVDISMLLENYKRIRTEKYPDIDRDCFRIYLWMLAEINAQSLDAATSGDRLFD